MKDMTQKTAERIAQAVMIFAFVGIMWFTIEKADVAQRRHELDLADATAITQAAVDEQADLKRRYDLAIEFGFNPIIVEIVDDYAKAELLHEKSEAYRLIQTHEYLTHIFLSMIYTESKGNVNARGDKGKAYGLTQIWLSTARDYEEKITANQLMDPDANIRIAFRHFNFLLKKYRGNFTLALLAWNRGQQRVDEMIAWGRSPANGYGERVFNASVRASRYDLLASRP